MSVLIITLPSFEIQLLDYFLKEAGHWTPFSDPATQGRCLFMFRVFLQVEKHNRWQLQNLSAQRLKWSPQYTATSQMSPSALLLSFSSPKSPPIFSATCCSIDFPAFRLSQHYHNDNSYWRLPCYSLIIITHELLSWNSKFTEGPSFAFSNYLSIPASHWSPGVWLIECDEIQEFSDSFLKRFSVLALTVPCQGFSLII